MYTLFHMQTSGPETGMVLENVINTMAADALATYVARSSIAMVLNMQHKLVLVFYEDGFQETVPFKCWWIIEQASTY